MAITLTQNDYELRVCFFIDILGFKSHINNIIQNDNINEANLNYLYMALLEFKELQKEVQERDRNCKVTQFSDCIVISFHYQKESNLFYSLLDILYLQISLVQKGILLRGGVSIGKLIHTDEIVFGEALVEAYTLESKKARYPRIIVDDLVVEISKNFGNHIPEVEEDYIKQLIKKDDDGNLFLNYFESAITEFDNLEDDLPCYINNIKTNALHKFDELTEADPAYEKLSWLNDKLTALKQDYGI